jgi:hypothetical protein
MIVPTYLDDGSEGFGLDWDVAGPMLDDFFGVTAAQRADEEASRDDSGTVGNANAGPEADTPRGTGASSEGVASGGKASPSPTAARRR